MRVPASGQILQRPLNQFNVMMGGAATTALPRDSGTEFWSLSGDYLLTLVCQRPRDAGR